jgi:hypothetical protein
VMTENNKSGTKWSWHISVLLKEGRANLKKIKNDSSAS